MNLVGQAGNFQQNSFSNSLISGAQCITTLVRYNASSIFLNLAISLGNYQISNAPLNQSDSTKGGNAAQKMFFLIPELAKFAPRLNNYYFKTAAIGMGFFNQSLKPKVLDNYPFIKKIHGFNHSILQHIDSVLNVAILVNAIAHISAGFYIVGATRLFGLSLIPLKRWSYLSENTEKGIRIIITVSNIIFHSMNFHTNRLIKAYIIIPAILNLIRDIANLLNHYLRFRHQYNPIQFSESDLEKFSSVDYSPEVNETYFFSDITTKPFTEEMETLAAGLSINELKRSLDLKIQEKNIKLTDSDKVVLNNYFTDKNFNISNPKFGNALKLAIHFMLRDHENFETKFNEFFSSYDTSFITSTLPTNTTDRIDWAVHQILSKMRGKIIQKFQEWTPSTPTSNQAKAEGSQSRLELPKGSLYFQNILYLLYKTYECQFIHSNIPSLEDILRTKLFLTKFENNTWEELRSHIVKSHITTEIANQLPEDLKPSEPLLANHLEANLPVIRKFMLSPDMIIDEIYQSVPHDPTVQVAAESPAQAVEHVERRQSSESISQKAVLTWLEDFFVKNSIALYSSQFNQKYVTVGADGQFYLTKQGVALLLWDLGILSYKPRVES